MTTDKFGAREQWLHDAAQMIAVKYGDVFAEHFGAVGGKRLANVRVSTGFPSRRGENGKVIGQCWNDKVSRDKSHHIFISPLLEDATRVVTTLAHELVHAADNGEHQHKGTFVKAIRGMGLEGKPTATFAGPEFAKWVKTEVVPALGKYPHVALTPTLTTKTQKTYMERCTCSVCGYTVRTTRKWLDIKVPKCPVHNQFMEVG